MGKRRAKGKKKETSVTKPNRHGWNRKRIAGWGAPVVLSLLLPTLRDQGYLRQSPYILPMLWMLTTLLYTILAITSERAIKIRRRLTEICNYSDIGDAWGSKHTAFGVYLGVVVIALGLLAIQWCFTLSASIQHLASFEGSVTQPYPWLSWGRYLDEHGNVKAIRLSMAVRDYPPTESERQGLASMSVLEHLHVRITTPIQVSPASSGWHSCVVANIASEHWNYDDSTWKPVGTVDLKRDITVLEMRATASNGAWTSTLILRRNGARVDYDEYLSGRFVTGGPPMSLHETQTGTRPILITTDPAITLSKHLLLGYGVPIGQLKGDELETVHVHLELSMPPPRFKELWSQARGF